MEEEMTKNDITGDTIATKHPSQNYLNNWETIFGKKAGPPAQPVATQENQPDPIKRHSPSENV